MNSKLFSLKAITLFCIATMFVLSTGFAQDNPSTAEMKEKKADITIEKTSIADPSKNPVQTTKISVNETTADATVEIDGADAIYFMPFLKPLYVYGNQELYLYPTKEARYPAALAQERVQGIVIVRIIVEKDGSFTNPEVITSVHPLLDKEALRVVSTLKNFNPGENKDGEAVRCYVDIPVPFLLDPKK